MALSAISIISWFSFYTTVFRTNNLVAVLYYDHCLTFGEEYRRVWKNIGCRASWFFILNRYFSFFAVSPLSIHVMMAANRYLQNIAIVCGTFWTFTSLEVRVSSFSLSHIRYDFHLVFLEVRIMRLFTGCRSPSVAALDFTRIVDAFMQSLAS